MVLANEQRENPGRSVRLNFDLSLSADCAPLVRQLKDEVLQFHGLRKPRPSTIAKIEDALDCVLANLLNARRASADCHVAISMREQSYTKTRYLQRGLSFKNVQRVIDYLRRRDRPYIDYRQGFLDRRRNTPIGRSSRIKATINLLNRFANTIETGNQEQRPEGDKGEIINNQANRQTMPITGRITLIPTPSSDTIRLRDTEGKLVEYEDTDATRAMRTRLEQWNRFMVDHHWIDLLLPDADIESLYTRHPPEADQARFGDEQDPSYIDFARVRLHRVFNDESFDHGGRFYGGWWQQVPSQFRRYLTINGVPTRELDYSNLHAAMLYAQERLPLVEDAYTLPGVPGEYRELIKKTFFKMINARERQRIMPPPQDQLPPGFTWAQLQEAVRVKHQPIARYLNSGIGLELQKIDADIAEDVMLAMMRQDCLVLPIHDSFIAYIGSYETMLAEMRRAYRDRMQAEIQVEPDAIFLDFEILNAEAGPDIQDFVEQWQAQAGYDGYRERRREFLGERDAAWHARFGDQGIG